jgi:hypothetical protein
MSYGICLDFLEIFVRIFIAMLQKKLASVPNSQIFEGRNYIKGKMAIDILVYLLKNWRVLIRNLTL